MPPRRGVALFCGHLIWERPLVLQSEGIFVSLSGKESNFEEKSALMLLSVMVIAAAIACKNATSAPGTITDDSGRAVHLNSAPTRIVSHVPSITETLFALGLDEKIVGVSDYCDYPEAAKAKPKVGGYFTPSIETIVAHAARPRPDRWLCHRPYRPTRKPKYSIHRHRPQRYQWHPKRHRAIG